MLMGASTVNLAGSDFATANTNYGPLAARRSYQGASATYPASFAACNAHIDWNATTMRSNYVSVFSMKPDIDDAATSALDADLENFLESIPVNHRALLTIWHEGDGKVRSNAFTKTEWQNAVGHFLERVVNFGSPNICGGVILEAYQPHSGTDYEDMIPTSWHTDTTLDWFGVDGYSDLGSKGNVWDWAIDYSQSYDVPWGVAESGVKSGSVTGNWMSDQVSYCKMNDAEFFCWFDNTVGTVLATPGTSAEGKASAQMASKLLKVDPSTWAL
jgi:hypothetical protein